MYESYQESNLFPIEFYPGVRTKDNNNLKKKKKKDIAHRGVLRLGFATGRLKFKYFSLAIF